jgi:hypothetical protein
MIVISPRFIFSTQLDFIPTKIKSQVPSHNCQVLCKHAIFGVEKYADAQGISQLIV